MSSLYYTVVYALLIEVSSHLLNETDFYFPSQSEHSGVGSEIKSENCIKCPPGWGVKKVCTSQAPTECERCVTGDTYSSQYSNTGRCWPCSRCGVGLYEARKCSGKRDTICDDCTRFIYKPEIRSNKDFHKKCSYLFLSKSKLRDEKIMEDKFQT